MKYLFIAITLFTVTALGFCVWVAIDATHLTKGTVIEKRYFPAYTSTTYHSSSSYDSHGNVTGSTSYPVTQYHPESWSITIHGIGDDGKERSRLLPVDQQEFHEVHVGDEYTVGVGITKKTITE